MRFNILIPALILLAACSTPSPAAPSGPEAGQLGETASPAATAPAASPPVILSSGPLVLAVISPQDQAVVNTPQIELNGSVSRDAVLTINTEIYILPPGDFSIPLTLEEGANALEIVVSDSDGNEIAFILVVTYQP